MNRYVSGIRPSGKLHLGVDFVYTGSNADLKKNVTDLLIQTLGAK